MTREGKGTQAGEVTLDRSSLGSLPSHRNAKLAGNDNQEPNSDSARL